MHSNLVAVSHGLCQTPFTRYRYNRLFNQFDNQLYRTNEVSVTLTLWSLPFPMLLRSVNKIYCWHVNAISINQPDYYLLLCYVAHRSTLCVIVTL